MSFLLEERLPQPREQDFLAETPGPNLAGWDTRSWWDTFANHYSTKVALPLRRATDVSTFALDNKENHLDIESHQDVVRLESLRALYQRYPGDFDSPSELADELRNLVLSRQPGRGDTFGDDQRSRLAMWLNGLNDRRDARPAFAAPLGEVERLLAAPDWARQMRNVLGLAHFAGSRSRPLSVVLCRYNLSRVERAARRASVPAWAAIPTVLEAGGASGPGAAFFPFPRAAAASNPFGFGVTVNLAPDGTLDFKSELLHFRLEYRLDDFAMVGELTDEITEAQLSTARQRHFDLLERDLLFRADVP